MGNKIGQNVAIISPQGLTGPAMHRVNKVRRIVNGVTTLESKSLEITRVRQLMNYGCVRNPMCAPWVEKVGL